MEKKFTDTELRRILDQALTYRCACPAQVAELILEARKVWDYERRCLEEENNLPETHETIGLAVERAHRIYEDCIERVLDIENWDRDTLEMPEDLRKKSQPE